MRDHNHIVDQDSGICPHCGQALPPAVSEPSFGDKGANKPAIVVTIAVHAILLTLALIHHVVQKQAASKPSSAVYISPQLGKQSKPEPQTKPQKQAKQAPVNIARLPNTITLPNERRVEPVKVEEVKPPPPKPVEEDMAAYIAARQKERGATQAPKGETDDERGKRNALANIAALNGKSGADANDTGGVFSVNTSYHTADLKFRGFNANFKRRWLTQLTVEQGSEPDIETAVIKKMIELIRREKKGDFIWESHRLSREVQLSARVEDTPQLFAFLMKEMYPEYRPPAPHR